MQVFKFGGTSVANASRIEQVANIIDTPERKIVVLSAMAGITNTLYDLVELSRQNNEVKVNYVLSTLHKQFFDACTELNIGSQTFCQQYISAFINYIKNLARSSKLDIAASEIVSFGEIVTTQIVHKFLERKGMNCALIPALSYMWLDPNGEPDHAVIREKLESILDHHRGVQIFITEGFICRTHTGYISNLQRGGSDYSATIVAAAVQASVVQIWSDIDGFRNNDPRYVENTATIRKMSYDEAAELAYFGAKIMHPASVHPARKANIPLLLKNTLNPTDAGTLIHGNEKPENIKAVAAKDHISAIRIESGRMLNAYGFLKKIFSIFEKYQVPIDVITTSEVAVSVTIESQNLHHLMIDELQMLGKVSVFDDQTVVCIVGDFGANRKSVLSAILNNLTNVPLRMVSYGGNDINISLVIDNKYKTLTLNNLQNLLINESYEQQSMATVY